MSVSDDRLTRKTAQNLAKAKNVLEKEEQFKRTGRSRSKRRGPEEPRYMDSTVSFRAKSPRRKTKSENKKPLPFLAGSADNNLARYQGIEPESTDIGKKKYYVKIIIINYLFSDSRNVTTNFRR